MKQQKKLEDYDSYDLLWATVKYDELLQVVFQNIILVERKHWRMLICDSSDVIARSYFERRAWLLRHKVINEDELRKEVINRVHQ
jgi:hypothetical protein